MSNRNVAAVRFSIDAEPLRAADPANDRSTSSCNERCRDIRRIGFAIALIVAWAWALLAGVGGLILLIHEDAWPITNGGLQCVPAWQLPDRAPRLPVRVPLIKSDNAPHNR